MADPSSQTREVERVISIWKRRKWLAIPMFLLPLSALTSFIVSLPSVYRATATLLVEDQQVPESMVPPTITSEIESRVRSLSREVLSRARLGALVDRFELQRGGASRDEAIEQTRQAISTETKGTSINRRGATTITLSVSYDATNPQTAAGVANTVASFFVDENFKMRDRLAVGTTEFLKSQLEKTRVQLNEQEKRIGAFRGQYVGELPQQMQANMLTLDRLDNALRVNLDNQTRVTQRRDGLLADQAALASGESAEPVGPPGTPEGDAKRLFQLNQQLTQLRTRFTEKYPDVVEVKAEIAAIEERLAKTSVSPGSTSGAAPVVSPQAARLKQSLTEAEAELSALKNEEKRLRSSIATYQTRIENTPKREQEYQQISRDYQATQELYQSMLKRLNDAQVSENMEQSQKGEQFRLVSPAGPPTDPDRPKRSRLLAVALVASLGLAGLSVFIAEYLDSSFHTVDELRQFTTLPVLTVIPRIVTEADRRRRRLRVRLGLIGTAVSMTLAIVVSYLIAHDNALILSLMTR